MLNLSAVKIALTLIAVVFVFWFVKGNTGKSTITGSWKWVKTWNRTGDSLTPGTTGQQQIITYKPNGTYDILTNDSLTATNVKFNTATARTSIWPDSIVHVIQYDTLSRYQVIEFKDRDTLILHALSENNSKVDHYAKFYRVR